MKKIILFLFVSITSFSQDEIRFSPFYRVNETASTITVQEIPEILLDKYASFGKKKKRINWHFVSIQEFEEVRGGTVRSEGVRFVYPVKIICHNYDNENEKYFFDLEITFIDGRQGLVFENLKTNLISKM